MAPRKSKKNPVKKNEINLNAHILGAGEVVNQRITDTLETNYMPYAMSVIVARALPDVRDGLKPVQRRTLYDMYELGIRYARPYRKCARIVGDTMG